MHRPLPLIEEFDQKLDGQLDMVKWLMKYGTNTVIAVRLFYHGGTQIHIQSVKQISRHLN